MANQSVRACQYLRMSREHQRYSPANQAAAIAEYALARGYEIVRTYRDNGRSGLTLQGREGLKELLTDVISGRADFSAVLVLDVSRWGRFQDPDQAAHYEFLCRQAGVSIEYCGEPFPNDAGAMTSIMKHLKRVMAGEFSRELGGKVLAAQLRVARTGYKLGGAAPFGLRRLLVDENGRAIRELRPGERKAVQSERVILVHGPETELAVIRDVFRWFVRENLPFVEIAERLAERGCVAPDGDAFSVNRISYLLRNPIYQGVYTFNKSTQRLKRGVFRNAPDQWVQHRMLEPIVSPRLFSAAQKLLREPRRKYTRAQLLAILRRLVRSGERLSIARIGQEGPSPAIYYQQFGSLERAFAEAGVNSGMRFRGPSRQPRHSREAILDGLRRLLNANGFITTELIRADSDLPGPAYIRRHFGSLLEAYRSAGWDVRHGDLRTGANSRRWRTARKTTELHP